MKLKKTAKKRAGKSIGKESKKVGHDIKEGSIKAWQETKDIFK